MFCFQIICLKIVEYVNCVPLEHLKQSYVCIECATCKYYNREFKEKSGGHFEFHLFMISKL